MLLVGKGMCLDYLYFLVVMSVRWCLLIFIVVNIDGVFKCLFKCKDFWGFDLCIEVVV